MAVKRVSIKNHSAEANLFARRTFITFLGVLAMLLILFNNIYDLEINSYEKYQTRSNKNRIKLLPVAPNRGLIYDRNGVLLAENKPVYSLAIIPEEVNDVEQTLALLSDIVDVSDEQKQNFLKSMRYKRRFKPLELLSRLNDEQVAKISVSQHLFPGVIIEARLKRYYPFGDLTTHSLGYVAKINSNDLLKLEQQGKSDGYKATRDIGKLGLEKYYQDLLHGSMGYQEVEVNNQGRILRTLSFTPPVPGKDLTLSLDIELQMIAKRALSGSRGAVVAIDPRDGGVLAFYSNPSYDGNLFVHGISSKNYKKLQNRNRPLINRATKGTYPPASTIKPFLGLSGLENQMITTSSKIWDEGFFKLKNGKRKYRDHLKWGHGWVTLEEAVMRSCNTFFYKLSYELGIDKISATMAQFGFGEPTGIDIFEESAAILPSRGWKRARYNEPWYHGDTVNIGIGQGFWTVTPLQLAQATSILVNKGEIKEPHFLSAIHSPLPLTAELSNNDTVAAAVFSGADDLSQQDNSKNGITREISAFEINEKPPIELNNEQNWDIILEAMHKTVRAPSGTGYRAFLGSNYDAAGKSGTGEVVGRAQDTDYDATKISEDKRDNAMFIAFAPYTAPEIVVAIAIENVAVGGGGSNAGPVARQIMDQYFANKTLTAKE
ncbi:penicillin-binding protein 2 [Thalassotalea sp. ND16A]|uniref:penicillin-binding protein 2 n=1 Tax=Thalassotalea sp. ND16A TaxID=1535422 RepID=UPI00051A018D|nr:penicillin-binding protein 2 [Thalassotalea sp. ND16A]KGJ97188.1 Peptidoglycan glycosyltransferase [Thalassotalea sp. ND16A]